jgi:peptidoglycan hydrolase CwlO-like protein
MYETGKKGLNSLTSSVAELTKIIKETETRLIEDLDDRYAELESKIKDIQVDVNSLVDQIALIKQRLDLIENS